MADIFTNAVNKVVNTGVDLAANPLFSASSFAWNGKDLRRNVRYQKKMLKFQNAQNREQAAWSAREMPSLQMAGLRRAGLNPILAVTGSGGFSTDSANSASASPPTTGESFVDNQSAPAAADGNFVDELGSLWDSAANFFSDRFIKRETKEATKDKLKADRADSKARLAEAKTRQATAEEQGRIARTLVGINLRRARAEADYTENSATASTLDAFLNKLKKDFFEHWTWQGGDYDKALQSFLLTNIGKSWAIRGGNNEFLRVLTGAMYNGLRSEDWKFLRDQANFGINSAKGVGEAAAELLNPVKIFKQIMKKSKK